MKPYSNILIRIVLLASLWATGGYTAGVSLEIIGFDGYSWSTILVALNVLIGILLLKGIISDPEEDYTFFEKPVSYDPNRPLVGCLWLMPAMLIVVGASMWFWAIIIRLLSK